MANGNGAYDTYLMRRITSPPRRPISSSSAPGVIMTLALFFSKSAQNVIKTSVNLSRQTMVKRPSAHPYRPWSGTYQQRHQHLPRTCRTAEGSHMDRLRFNKQELTMEPGGAAFDLVRAS